MLSKDFKKFVALLTKHEVEYMIVGGYAVGVHGYPRYTGDLDIWLNPNNSNAIRILRAIDEFGFGSFKLLTRHICVDILARSLDRPFS